MSYGAYVLGNLMTGEFNKRRRSPNMFSAVAITPFIKAVSPTAPEFATLLHDRVQQSFPYHQLLKKKVLP